MATDTVTIDQFIAEHGIALAPVPADRNPNMAESHDMDHWKVILSRPDGSRRLRLTTYFSKGFSHHRAEPTAEEVLECLASDAAGYENAQSFEDWCAEYGYDTDSRSAERTYKAVKHASERLERFLGEDLYNILLWEVSQ